MSSAGTAYVDVEAKLDEFSSQIDDAVSSLDTQTIDVEAVASTDQAQAEIDGIEGSTIDVVVDAEVAGAESEIASIPDPDPVQLEVTANTDQAKEGIDELSGVLGTLESGLGGGGATGLLEGFAGAAGGAGLASSAAATGGIALLGVGINETVSSFGEAQAVAAETESMIAALGAGAVVTADHVGTLSQRIMEYSGFSDEAVQSGANTLLMFDNINNQGTFDRALNASADLARRLRTDVPSAARMLGIALQDPEAGMNRLRRAGVVLNDSQKETITAMMETGDVAGAQEIIFDALEGKIGNLAEAYGATLPGEIDKTNEAIDEHKEKIGENLAPAYEAALSAMDSFLMGQDAFISGLSNARSELEDFLGVSEEAKRVGPALGGSLDPASGALDDTADSAAALEQAISDLSSEIDGYLSGLYDVPDAQQSMRQSFAELSDAMNGGTWDEQADAMQGVVESTAEVIDAQVRTGASQEEMDATIYAAILSLNDLKNQGKLTADQVNGLTGEILGIPHRAAPEFSTPGLSDADANAAKFAEKIKQVDKMSANPTFSASGLDSVYSKSLNFLSTLNAIDGKVITSTFRTIGDPTGKASAVGGPLDRGELSLVGEEGPELFVPNTGGNIVPAMQTASLMMGQGATYNINVNAATGDGHELARIIRDEIRTLERAGR